MCGIAGIIPVSTASLDSRLIPRILRHLEHRGPDDQGCLLFSRDGAQLCREWPGQEPIAGPVLLHRRLSILDVTEAGWQPMGTPDGRYYIVFNGEIYNFLELRSELEALGHRFRSRSDTEVLLSAYVQWGTEVLARLVGMFAFAILDTRDRILFLARDFFGIKPLYYTIGGEGFAFASEINTLLEFPWVSRMANPERLYLYLRYGITDHGSGTMFTDIRQLPPAHYLKISLDNPRPVHPVRYWELDLAQRADLSFEEAAERLRELFLKNIRLHLRSDVPVGVALSGGIDSSSIVMAMRYLKGKDLKLHTFSYVADDPDISEERWVELVGQASGALMHKVWLRAEEIVADLGRLIHVHGEPFGSTNIYAQYRVFRLAREAGIKVTLDGQGADEILGGYRFYMAARLASLLRQGRWTEAGRYLLKASKWPGASNLWLLLGTADFLMPLSLQAPARRLIGKDLAPPWLNAAWFRERGVSPRIFNYTQGKEVLKEYLYRTISETSLPYLLRYQDRNSMAFSIESRVPFLTPELVEFILSLPEEYIIAPDGTSKAVFRMAMRGIVPDAVLDRRDKIGFATPESCWLNTLRPWVERTIRSEAAVQIPALNLKEVEREWEGVMQGRKHFDFRMWRWVNLIEWARLFKVRFE